MPEFICIGVPYWIGERPNFRSAAAIIKDSDFAARNHLTWVDVQPKSDDLQGVIDALAHTIQQHHDKIPLIFSGDCMSALGVVKGFQKPDLGILWYDAHGDFNTPETSPSGFLGGMPLAMLVGRGDQTYMDGISPVQENNIILSDARNLDAGEAEAVAASAIQHLPNVEQLLTVDLPQVPFYIHLDIDVVDSAELSSMAYPEPNGASIDLVKRTLKRLVQDGQVVGLLMSLYDASLNIAPEKHLQAVTDFAQTFIDAIRG